MTDPRSPRTFDPAPIDRVLDVAWEALEYQRFLAEPGPPGEDSYLFSEPKVRFEARPEDVLVTLGELVLQEEEHGVCLSAPATGAEVRVKDVTREQMARILQAIDGETSLAEISSFQGLDRGAVQRLLRAGFGTILFAPLAVSALERELSGLELVRFPGAPYEIVRNYWLNMIAVRRALTRMEASINDPESIMSLLRRLHVISLMGDDLHTFYRPASPVAKKGIYPGSLWNKASKTLETSRGTLFLEGPRVNAALLGGPAYQALVCEAAGDPGATRDGGELLDEAGVAWGRLVRARAETDEREAVWFCPPRPMRSAHWESLSTSLRVALTKARGNDREASVAALADFHQGFVRLHPFQAANQSLCMNIVGYVLGLSHGAGMPHTILDHLALRLSPAAYRRVFRSAVESYVVTGTPVERWRKLTERKQRFFEFVQRLGKSEQPAKLCQAEPESARLALIAV